MRLPSVAHGQVNQGSIQFGPIGHDIAEQAELARKLDALVLALGSAAIPPTLVTRHLKDFRSKQPSGVAQLSVAYSAEKDGRLSAEINAAHRPSGLKSSYQLFDDEAQWLRVDSLPSGKTKRHFIDHGDVVGDMLEYVPDGGEVAALFDQAPTAQDVAEAAFFDMARSAHYKFGSNHFKVAVPIIDASGYAASRHIELIDTRVNKLIRRRLSVTALTTIGAGPVDVTQSLVYDVEYKGDGGGIKKDGIRLTHTSQDGLSPQALTSLAETSDVVPNRINILNQALKDLSHASFADDKSAA